MIKKKFLYFGLSFLFISCTVDDSNVIEESDFYGDYNLISAETNREIDYNFDGETATDIIDDFDCFRMELKLNPDQTFREVIIDRKVTDTKVECTIIENNGNWRYLKELNQIEFSYLDGDGNLINKVTSKTTLDKNKSIEFSRDFTDQIGKFKAKLLLLYFN